jgi:uncharacterized protein
MTHEIQINKELFTLHQSGAVFWKAKNMLLISDVHLGKVAHFRKHGFAIPNEAVFENFHRLDMVVHFFNPETIVFLGDLFHSKINREWDLFAEWTKSVVVEIILVEGNHDIIAKQKFTDLGIKVFSEMTIDRFLLTHHPDGREDVFNFCGHIHPGIYLRGIGKQSLGLPCFFQRPNQMILPAFGEFTGKYYLMPAAEDKVYLVTKDEVIPVSGS